MPMDDVEQGAEETEMPSVNELSSLNSSTPLPPTENESLIETKIENGKLLFERRWYHRGQSVYIEGEDIAKFATTISVIDNDFVSVFFVEISNSHIFENDKTLSLLCSSCNAKNPELYFLT